MNVVRCDLQSKYILSNRPKISWD